jgi:hypothetical protein
MPDLTIDVAKAVVDKAIAHDAWAWDDAAAVTDELQVTTAQTLIDAATQASHNNSVADAVIAILHAANVEPQSAATRERYDEYVRKINEASALASTPKTNGNAPVEHASATPPAEPSAPVGFGTPTSSQEQGSPDSSVEADSTSAPASTADISDIFPGYDDLKAADVKKAILGFGRQRGSLRGRVAAHPRLRVAQRGAQVDPLARARVQGARARADPGACSGAGRAPRTGSQWRRLHWVRQRLQLGYHPHRR